MLLNSFLVIVLCVPCFKLFERATSTLLLLKKQCDVSLQHQVTEVKKLYCRQSNLPMRFFCSVSSFLSDLHKIHLMSFIIHNKVYAAYKYKRQVSQPFFVIQNSGFARVKPQQRRQRRRIPTRSVYSTNLPSSTSLLHTAETNNRKTRYEEECPSCAGFHMQSEKCEAINLITIINATMGSSAIGGHFLLHRFIIII